MKVVKIKDLLKKDMPLYYRREFMGRAVLETSLGRHEKRIDFTLEKTPYGTTTIQVSLIDDIDYPLVPVMSSLKSFILDLDRKGRLP